MSIIARKRSLSTISYKPKVKEFMDYMINGGEFIHFDVESTGLQHLTCKMVSCSAIKYRYEDGRFIEIARIDKFIDPDMPIPEEAIQVHGITDEQVADCPYEWELFNDVLHDFFGDNPVVCGYNVKFDIKFLELLWLRESGIKFEPKMVLDVMKMVQEHLDLKSAKLENAANELGANVGIKFHSSIDDVLESQRVMELLIPLYYDAKEPAKFRFNVLSVFYKYYSHKNERIYVNTYPESETYYDVYRKKWYSDALEGFDLADIQKDVLKMMGVKNEKELVNLYKVKDN